MNTFAQLLFLAILAAIIYSLVRPGSKAGDALVLVSDAVANVVGTATGYTQRGA